MNECPAELVVERGKYGSWIWAVCQPDACWGVHKEGVAASKLEAESVGLSWLRTILFQQGY